MGTRDLFRAGMARALGVGGLEAADAIEALIEDRLGANAPRAKRLPLDTTPVAASDVASARESVARLKLRKGASK